DGRTIAFLRCETFYRCNLYLLDLPPELQTKAEPRALTKQQSSMSRPVWTAGGQELVYLSYFGGYGVGSLYRVPVNGSAEPRRLDFAGQEVSSPALSRRGDRLAYSRGTREADLWTWERGELSKSPLSSTRRDGTSNFSPDGSRVAFESERSGAPEVW